MEKRRNFDLVNCCVEQIGGQIQKYWKPVACDHVFLTWGEEGNNFFDSSAMAGNSRGVCSAVSNSWQVLRSACSLRWSSWRRMQCGAISIATSVAKGSRLDVIADGYQVVVSNGLFKASPCSCTHVIHLCMHMFGRFMCQCKGSLLSKIGTVWCRSLLIAVTKIWRSLCRKRWRSASALRWGVRLQTWLILPVVICLSQRLSHACLSINPQRWNCERLIKTVIFHLMVNVYMDNCGNSTANTCIRDRLSGRAALTSH